MVLRRRQGAATWVRALDMATGPTCPSSDHLPRLFDAADFLESAAGGRLFQHAHRFVDGHRIGQTLSYPAGKYLVGPAVFRSQPGIGLEAHVDARALEVLLECDGHRKLDDLIAETALSRGETVEDSRTLLEAPVRQLVERGFMIPVAADGKGGAAC